MEITVKPAEKIEGQIRMPGDKSISHRALLLSSLAEGPVDIEGILKAGDTLSTLQCLKELGVEIEENGEKIRVKGRGLKGLEEPEDVLDAGNSATTVRLLTGLLAGQSFHSSLTGDNSLRKRPMNRVTDPLKKMGAFINGRQGSALLPLSIRGYDLLPISYALPVASAQVKSALLIAALHSRGITEILDPFNTRDHTERALRYLGADISNIKDHIVLRSPVRLKADKLYIPGDISAAAFFAVAVTLAPRGELYIEDVGVNPTRTGILDVLNQMGAEINILNEKEYNCEPVADLHVKGGRELKGVEITREMIPRLIDEIPVIAVAALFAEGDTVIKGASELRVKESDRLNTITSELRKMGADIQEFPDGLLIKGGNTVLSGAHCESHGDHRIAMALATAALFAADKTVIDGADAVDESFPEFFEVLNGTAT